jgi:hypothetical protein
MIEPRSSIHGSAITRQMFRVPRARNWRRPGQAGPTPSSRTLPPSRLFVGVGAAGNKLLMRPGCNSSTDISVNRGRKPSTNASFVTRDDAVDNSSMYGEDLGPELQRPHPIPQNGLIQL